jgi:hypothetical protein
MISKYMPFVRSCIDRDPKPWPSTFQDKLASTSQYDPAILALASRVWADAPANRSLPDTVAAAQAGCGLLGKRAGTAERHALLGT